MKSQAADTENNETEQYRTITFRYVDVLTVAMEDFVLIFRDKQPEGGQYQLSWIRHDSQVRYTPKVKGTVDKQTAG